VLAFTPPGVVQKIFSKEGLDKYYVSLFENAEQTFGEQDMGTAGDVYGWWIFGTGMTIKNTYLDEYDLGTISKVNYADSKYEFTQSAITGLLKYKWTYRWFLIPFSHQAECKFSVGTHLITSEFTQHLEEFRIDRNVIYTDGAPTIDCTDGDATQDSHWGYDWMKTTRDGYGVMLGENLKTALSSWLDSVDNIYESTKLANLDNLGYTLIPHLQEAKSDADSNLVMGYNYNITLNSETMSPIAHEDIKSYDVSSDVSTIFFEEYFNSIVELEKKSLDFYTAINNKNLPEGLSFELKAKDFRYIVDGMQKYELDAGLEVDCEYGDDNPTVHVDEKATFNLPISCTLKCGRDTILTSSFDMVINGNVAITAQGALTLENEDYQVKNFYAESKIGTKVLPEYLIRRIESYSNAANFVDDIEYFDNRFQNLTNLSVHTGKQFVRVSGNIKV
jgi:hypothetical protein